MTPYEEGYAAYCSGKYDNRYHKGTSEYYEYLRGWNTAKSDAPRMRP